MKEDLMCMVIGNSIFEFERQKMIKMHLIQIIRMIGTLIGIDMTFVYQLTFGESICRYTEESVLLKCLKNPALI